MLPADDHTPAAFTLPRDSFMERFVKRPIRRFGYPFYIFIVNRWLSRRYRCLGFHADTWLWGHRGNDFARHRHRVHQLLPLTGKDILIAGCGTGRDVRSWLGYRPGSLTGVDYFHYGEAWKQLRDWAHRRYPRTRLDFQRADLEQMDRLQNASFDVIGSDAVFEHVRNLPGVLRECHRLLKPKGILYATFGPLWYCWGGDHLSGFDGIANGYNHILLDPGAYDRYLSTLGDYAHSEHDGRTWIKHGLFSYLRPDEYIVALNDSGFERVYVGVVVEPRAVACLKKDSTVRRQLLNKHRELDLIISCMTIIYRKT